MTTPTSHPRPSPSKPTTTTITTSHLTPASASSPPPPSPAPKKPSHYRNGSLQHPPTTPTPGATPMAPSGTNGSITMVRSGTNGSAVGARWGMGTGTSAATPVGHTGTGTGTTASAGSPAVMAVGGGMGMGMGIAAPQDQEEDRRRRIEAIVRLVGARWGTVGPEGVERAAKRVGLECLWEEGRRGGERVLSVAGQGLLVEVSFEGDAVGDVVVSFPGSREGAEGEGRVAEVLGRDLKGEGDVERYVQMDRFAGNLERLARMDQLGGEGVSCFDAVEGIYKSLERVYEWEVGKARARRGGRAVEEVMSQHSGAPKMHVRRRVGLAVQFWMEERFLSARETATSDEMDVDEPAANESEEEPVVWSAIIECEACSAEMYTPIRISDQWVSKEVGKSPAQETNQYHISDTNIDWLEVPVTPSNADASSTTINPGLPDVRFVAKFEPPIVVPLQTALQIHESVSSPVDQATVLPTTFEALVFADVDARDPLLSTPRVVEHTISSYSPTTGALVPRNHRTTLYTQPSDYARSITDLPFKHPMQIINLLPTLRQWALVSSILRRSFIPPPSEDPTPTARTTATATTTTNGDANITNANAPQSPPQSQTLEDELADFLASPPPNNPPSSNNPTKDTHQVVDVSLTTTTTTLPLPRFTIHFQNPRFGGKLARVAFSIGLNGVVEGVDVNDGGPDEDGGMESVRLRDRVRRVLEVGEDVGVVVEWLCRRV